MAKTGVDIMAFEIGKVLLSRAGREHESPGAWAAAAYEFADAMVQYRKKRRPDYEPSPPKTRPIAPRRAF
jgi:hypothetical protein